MRTIVPILKICGPDKDMVFPHNKWYINMFVTGIGIFYNFFIIFCICKI